MFFGDPYVHITKFSINYFLSFYSFSIDILLQIYKYALWGGFHFVSNFLSNLAYASWGSQDTF